MSRALSWECPLPAARLSEHVPVIRETISLIKIAAATSSQPMPAIFGWKQDPITRRDILREFARQIPPSERREFLEILIPIKPLQELLEAKPDPELMEDIQKFADRVENGEYCYGWGWDDEI